MRRHVALALIFALLSFFASLAELCAGDWLPPSRSVVSQHGQKHPEFRALRASLDRVVFTPLRLGAASLPPGANHEPRARQARLLCDSKRDARDLLCDQRARIRRVRRPIVPPELPLAAAALG